MSANVKYLHLFIISYTIVKACEFVVKTNILRKTNLLRLKNAFQ